MTDEAIPTVTVGLPAALCALFPGCPTATRVQAGTVKQMVDALDVCWPGLRHRLCDETPAVRRHIRIFVAGERAGLDTVLPDDADVEILTAISGG